MITKLALDPGAGGSASYWVTGWNSEQDWVNDPQARMCWGMSSKYCRNNPWAIGKDAKATRQAGVLQKTAWRLLLATNWASINILMEKGMRCIWPPEERTGKADESTLQNPSVREGMVSSSHGWWRRECLNVSKRGSDCIWLKAAMGEGEWSNVTDLPPGFVCFKRRQSRGEADPAHTESNMSTLHQTGRSFVFMGLTGCTQRA